MVHGDADAKLRWDKAGYCSQIGRGSHMMHITHCVGPFAFPLTDDTCWREEALCYRPGKTLDVGVRMPGFKLMLQDDKGEYPHSSRALIFEGSMLVYDPQ